MSKVFPYEHGQYIRVAEYSIGEVLPYVINDFKLIKLKKQGIKKGTSDFISITERNYDGHMVKMYSQRYQLFASKGVECVHCGLVGVFFGLEKIINQEGDRYHFNLYGIRDGQDMLITKDHIIPKSKGGKNSLSNYQVMCYACNSDKSNNIYV